MDDTSSPAGRAADLSNDGRGPHRELILYATPTGPLADGCIRFFAEARRVGSTTAQTYPPHCTLTGFFRRTTTGADIAWAEIRPVLADAGPVPVDAVAVTGLVDTDSWVGLELDSTWLTDLARRVAEAHRPRPGDDAVRVKDRLHLSLAYGVEDLTPYRDLAHRIVDPTAAAGWRVALWERRAGNRWRRFEL